MVQKVAALLVGVIIGALLALLLVGQLSQNGMNAGANAYPPAQSLSLLGLLSNTPAALIIAVLAFLVVVELMIIVYLYLKKTAVNGH